MNESQHPDHTQLIAYANQPDADNLRQVSLHLLRCKQCRDEVNLSTRLKSGFSLLQSEHCSDEQQRVVDDFLSGGNNIRQQEELKQKIRNEPQLLKSALFSLSHRTPKEESIQKSHPDKLKDASKGWSGVINEWLNLRTSTWATMGMTAVITLVFTVMLLQQHSIESSTSDGISVASYQDNNVIRFYPSDQLPGIGFFNGAVQSSQPYQNMQISFDQDQMLKLSWKPVELASSYALNLYRFSGGGKKLQETFKTNQTLAHYKLKATDYNQRFEWVLSGHTRDDKTFVTSGGFIVHKPSNRGDL